MEGGEEGEGRGRAEENGRRREEGTGRRGRGQKEEEVREEVGGMMQHVLLSKQRISCDMYSLSLVYMLSVPREEDREGMGSEDVSLSMT